MKKVCLTKKKEEKYGFQVFYQICVNLPLEEEDLQKLSKFLNISGEYKITCCENIPFEIDENDNIYEVDNLLKYFQKNNIPDESILQLIHVVSGGGDKYDLGNYDGLKYEFINNVSDFASLAYELYKNHECFYLPFENIPYELIEYIDWEKIGRDLKCEGGCILTKDNRAILINAILD